jgi:hypothetical protein
MSKRDVDIASLTPEERLSLLEELWDWYEARRAGLGEEFLAALNAPRDRLIEHPGL